MARERRSLLRDAFHQVAVTADRIRVVIDDLVPGPVEARGEPRLGDRHADAIAEALAEWAGCHFDAHSMPALRVSRRFAAPLAEALQLVERQVVTGQMQQAI